MPNRLLREGICTSDTINPLSPEAEIMLYRLLVVADDYGYMDGRVTILKAQCFPLRESATPQKIEVWLRELAKNGLIARYKLDNKTFLCVNKWEQRVRSRPKYVGPDADGCQPIDGQWAGNGQADDGLGKGKGKGKGATSRPGRELLSLPLQWSPANSTTENLAREFSLAPEDIDAYVGAFRDACSAKGYRYADFEAAFRNCVRQDWPRFRHGKAKPIPSGHVPV